MVCKKFSLCVLFDAHHGEEYPRICLNCTNKCTMSKRREWVVGCFVVGIDILNNCENVSIYKCNLFKYFS